MTTNIIFILIVVLILVTVILYVGYFSYYQIQNSRIEQIINNIKKNSDLHKLEPLKEMINTDIEEILFEVRDPKIREMCKYAVSNGKRIRPIIGYSIIKKFNNNINVRIRKIVSNIELLHNASLIIDDIMDNDKYRRNKLAVPSKYGNNIAQLVSVELMRLFIKTCFNGIMAIQNDPYYSKNKKQISEVLSNVLDENLEELIEGQYYDLDNKKNNRTTEIIDKKTGSIFKMIFISSWILSCPNDLFYIDQLTFLATNFGEMFQIYDDFVDYYNDQYNNKYNFVIIIGTDWAYKLFNNNYRKLLVTCQQINILTDEIRIISNYLKQCVDTIYSYLKE